MLGYVLDWLCLQVCEGNSSSVLRVLHTDRILKPYINFSRIFQKVIKGGGGGYLQSARFEVVPNYLTATGGSYYDMFALLILTPKGRLSHKI